MTPASGSPIYLIHERLSDLDYYGVTSGCTISIYKINRETPARVFIEHAAGDDDMPHYGDHNNYNYIPKRRIDCPLAGECFWFARDLKGVLAYREQVTTAVKNWNCRREALSVDAPFLTPAD